MLAHLTKEHTVIDNFPAFAKIVNLSFQNVMAADRVFVVNVDGDDLYARYLAAFPAGTNPLFKQRTEHDCSCCKQFIRRAGAAVAVDGQGSIKTIWADAARKAPAPYNQVARALHEIVSAAGIKDLYRVGLKEGSFGTQQTRSMKDGGPVLTWNHLFTGPIPRSVQAASPDQVRGDYRTTVQVFERGLTELEPSAVATVLALVQDNMLYRGEEHKPALIQFQAAQRAYAALEGPARQTFCWTNAHGPASRFRNTVIGTLVQDLSSGQDIEQAVKSFETKVAPQNYKRTSALITPAMVKKAMETIKELGLEPALERRFARLDDISVRDVLWVDSTVKPLMKGGLGDVLLQHAEASTARDVSGDEDRAEPISMDDFIKNVLPGTTSMDLLLRGGHLGNLMSLTAPVHPEPKQLFRWTNDFAWSYGGNVTDSIKERVKRAGGLTDAQLRISLSWYNFDDLDLHVQEPGGTKIYYASKRGRYGALDVDMNAHVGATREAVENVAFPRAPDGVYRVGVHNFRKREAVDVGFTVEVENAGRLSHFSYRAAVRDQSEVHVVDLHVKGGVITDIKVMDAGIMTTAIAQEKWGLRTEQYIKVNAVTLSPNYWGGNAVGNRHTFFVLDGARNDEPTRGIYNEFLHPRLEPHRKVFEVIGEKTKCQPTDGQLSGVGFSSTRPDAVTVRVKQGKKTKLYNVKIGGEIPQTTNKESRDGHQHV